MVMVDGPGKFAALPAFIDRRLREPLTLAHSSQEIHHSSTGTPTTDGWVVQISTGVEADNFHPTIELPVSPLNPYL